MFSFLTKKKSKAFEELRTFIREIPDIHYGGCGFAAVVLYDKLIELGYKNVEIIYGYRLFDFGYEDNSEAIKSNDITKASSCGHAFIKLRGEYLDCKGEVNINSYNRTLKIPKEMVLESLRKIDLWNPSFDRDEYLPEIEEKIGYKIL